MNTGQWEELEKILDKAIELKGKEQEEYIKYACDGNQEKVNEIKSLLNAIKSSEKEHFLENSPFQNDKFCEEIDYKKIAEEFIGKKIGPFELKKQIGAGGMSLVFRAERVDSQFTQQVAIKLIKSGLHSEEILQRFELEKQILANLSHPHIAQLYDGGMTSDGNPYLIMEYVDGKPIDEYCNENKLTVTERLNLFKDVCNAVSYAHNNLIVHRDLKAQNIFVTNDGMAKVLDFGIAKLLDVKQTASKVFTTQPGKQLWTPQYASPEQINGETVTTATDIYSLGVLLHKLLTDCYPFNYENKNISQILKTVNSSSPNSLSDSFDISNQKEVAQQRDTTTKDLKKIFKGDLEAIRTKTTQRDKAQRYSSVAELVEDINNYQNNLPINAKKGNTAYNFKKFIKRNYVGLSLVAMSLVLIISLTFYYTQKISRERDLAQRQAQKAEQLTIFLMDLFEANRPSENKGKLVTAGELLVRAEHRAGLLDSQPAIQAKMFDVIGRIYRRLGEFEKSYTLLKRSLSIRKKIFGLRDSKTLASMDHLGVLLTEMGTYDVADSILTKTLQIRHKFFDSAYLAAAVTQSNLAYVLRKKGHYTEAEKLYRKSIQTKKAILGTDNARYLETLSSLGTTLHYQGDYATAAGIFRKVLNHRRKMLGPVHPKLAQSINNLGAVLMNRGRFKQAKILFDEALVMRKHLYDKPHPKIALMLNNMGYVLYFQNKFKDAGTYLGRALKMRRKIYGTNSRNSAISMFCLGKLMLAVNRPDSALALFSKAHRIFKEELTENHSLTVRSYIGMGSAYARTGNIQKSARYLHSGFQQIQQIHSTSSLEYVLVEKQLALFMLSQNQFQEAASHFEHALQTLHTIEGNRSIRQQELQKFLTRSRNKNNNISY